MAGCGDTFVPDMSQPVLVTLPVSTPGPDTSPTPAEEQITPTVTPATPTPTEPVPPTPLPGPEGLGAAGLLWQWDEVAPPSALAATGTRLAVLAADGRFLWINTDTGRTEGSVLLWASALQGDTWGEVYTDGTVALVAARETTLNDETGLADSRARLVVYGAEGNRYWELPEIDQAQHFYSAALASGPGIVVVGKWPYGFDDNTLAGYELFTGNQLWEIGEDLTGYQQLIHDGTRLYALLNSAEGGAVAAFDLRTGDELWRWSDESIPRPDQIALDENRVYVLSVETTLALDPLTGEVHWSANFQSAPEAGLALHENLLYLAPAPTAELGFRPGIVALNAEGGQLMWHALNGLLADPVAVGDGALWTIVKDFDSGNVWLSGLEPDTGLELVRLLIGDDPDVLYRLVALGSRVYVLGDSLQAYGY